MDKKTNWMQIFITALITGVVTVLTAMIIFHFQQPKNLLVYSIQETIPFESPTENLGIFHIWIKNKGSHLEEDITCEIRFSSGVIDKYRVKSETAISYSDSATKGNYKISFPNFNPDEKITISILLASKEALPKLPEVYLRSKGTNGEIEEGSDKPTQFGTVVIAVLSAFAGLLTLFTSRRKIFKKSVGIISETDQIDVFVHLCSEQGLLDEAENYLQISEDVSYWSEADKLTKLAIKNVDTGKAEKIRNVLVGLMKQNMATRSKGIVLYDIAKIEEVLGNKESAFEYLSKAKKKIPEIVSIRMKVDPIFIEKE